MNSSLVILRLSSFNFHTDVEFNQASVNQIQHNLLSKTNIYLCIQYLICLQMSTCEMFMTSWIKRTRDWLKLSELTKNYNLRKEMNSQQAFITNSFDRNSISKRPTIKQLLQKIHLTNIFEGNLLCFWHILPRIFNLRIRENLIA